MLKIRVNGFEEDCIKDPNTYFDLNKEKEWFNNPRVKEIIKNIDDTVVVKDEYLESPVFGGMSPERLSGGCKTVIMMEVLDDCSMFATKCGDNCAPEILKIAERKDLRITLHHPMRFPKKFDAYMMDTGVYVHSRLEFVEEFYRIIHMHENDEIER